jgi:hypothetical protein
MPRNQLIEFRKGTIADWLAVDPILYESEPGYETNTGRMKIGDGINHWSVLPYRDQTIAMVDNGDGSVLVTADGTAETAIAGNLLVEATDTILGLSAQRAGNLSDLASAVTARSNLGLGSAATHASTDFDPYGSAGAVSGALTSEANTARNANNLTSGTVADARFPTRLADATVASTVDNLDGSITMTMAV